MSRLYVFTDCPEVTSESLRHQGYLSQLKVLRLGGLPTGYLTDALQGSLHSRPRQELLGLGDPDSPPETAIPAVMIMTWGFRALQLLWPFRACNRLSINP